MNFQGRKYLIWLSLLSILFLMDPSVPVAQSKSPNSSIFQSKIAFFDSLATSFCEVNLDSTFFYYEKSIALLTQTEQPKEALLRRYEMANCAYLAQAIEVMDKQLQLIENQDFTKTDKAFQIKVNQSRGVYYYTKGDYEKAIEYSQKAFDEIVTTKGFEEEALFGLYNNLGMMSLSNGDYVKGAAYFKSAIQTLEKTTQNKADHRFAVSYNNLALAYQKTKAYPLANQFYHKVIDIYKANPENSHIRASLGSYYTNLALNYLELNQMDSTIILFEKALKVDTKKSWNWQIYNGLGFAYEKQKQFEQAKKFYLKSLKIRLNRFGQKHPRTANAYYHLGSNEATRGDLEKGLSYLQKALTSSILDYNDSLAVRSLPPLEGILSDKVVLLALKQKGHIFNKKYNQTKSVTDLEAALQHYELAINLVEQTRRGYKSEGAKQFLTEEFIDVFEQGIATALLLENLHQTGNFKALAFDFAERSKAVLLLEAIKDANAKQFAGIPDSLLEQEKRLKVDVAFYEKQVHRAKIRGEQAKINAAEGLLFQANERYEGFIANLEKIYPTYYQLKYNNTMVVAKTVQQEMDEATALIEYFMGDSTLYIFTLTKDTFKVSSQPLSNDFLSTIFNFRNALTDLNFLEKPIHTVLKDLNDLGFSLYQCLLPNLPDNIKKLTIVPDGILGYFPFETLISTELQPNSNLKTLPYLIKEKAIAYAYSATFLNEVLTKKTPKTKEIYGGFAAHYEKTSTEKILRGDYFTPPNITPLPNATVEVERIAALTNGKAHLKEAANEANFKKKAGDYKVLHLAMHGFLEDTNPLFSHLLFTPSKDSTQDNQLTALEIYNLELHAELAVLSACNTGYGKVQRGEGIMSLSRAFAFAGCPAVVMSLWSVPDETTSDIMIRFFEQLEKNAPKDIALQKAKLEYLNGQDQILAHPVFWAGFIPMGNMRPIDFSNAVSWTTILLISIGLISTLALAFFLFLKKEKIKI